MRDRFPPQMSDDQRTYRTRWRARVYEVDVNGHVNNAVYLNYVEQVAVEHAEAAGFGRELTMALGGSWVVHKHEIVYRQPARAGDELELTTLVESFRGARAWRRTIIERVSDGAPIAEALTEWVWVRAADGRPVRVPPEIARAAGFSPS